MRSSFFRADDDRGNSVSYRDPMYHGSELSKNDRGRVNRRQNNLRPWLLVLVITVSLGFQVVAILQSSIPTIVTRLALTLTLTLLAWWFVIPIVRRVLWSRYWMARYKSLGRCPACQYSLATLEPARDGCTVCPECGGAWRLPQ